MGMDLFTGALFGLWYSNAYSVY